MASTEPAGFGAALFIDTIKCYPMVYDKRHDRYKDIEYKNQTWKKIAQDLGVNGFTVAEYQAEPRLKASLSSLLSRK
ncbi:hypothetical protein HPB49_015790 [Dermacentor silvarum]|uniref:Uncharacterized protein n=1 Tax=Dermacentor silvarum TaxID=543639 RepID=A0ACB8CA62_DERSI|nr:hypothetical protein HPB49_015790 [Dermacentor silvarum]